MTEEELYRIWDRFEQSPVLELEAEISGEWIRLSKLPTAGLSGPDHTGKPAETPAAAPAAAAEKTKTENVSTPEEGKAGTEVTAPLVGTFYRAPGPGEEPFVRTGQKVKKGDTLGIIEAMKLMNEISAPCDGTVGKISAGEGTLVEYGQLLMVIEEDV